MFQIISHFKYFISQFHCEIEVSEERTKNHGMRQIIKGLR